MATPIVVIVGRPNVGKSTLFNRIVGRQEAIVQDIPGVTRDRNYKDAVWDDYRFTVVDTGGFFPQHDDNIFVQIKEQALFAIEEADVIIHLLDGKDGVNPFDHDLVQVLRASGKAVVWAINKVDALQREDRAYDFYSLGIEEIIPFSALTGYNHDDLMDRVTSYLQPAPELDSTVDYPKVAIIGRPNVGKSTIVNAVLGKDRMLVSPVAGTTRDAVDSVCSYYKKKYLIIDTAGMRRKDSHHYDIDRFAMVRAMRSIERCDVAVVVMDASTGVVSDDQKIAGMVLEYMKGAIFIFNKWDLVEDPVKTYKELMDVFHRKMFFLTHSPTLTTSGVERTRLTKLFPLIDKIVTDRRMRIPTAKLNRFCATLNLPSSKGKKLRVYYMTQYAVSPPAFTLFVNNPDLFRDSHLRHIEDKLREAFGFEGVPLRLVNRISQ